MFAQSTSQYYFVLQSLHKVLPSTTLYYQACTKYFPLLCTTKLAQSTSQYYFVLQSLHKVLLSTTLYQKACPKYVPVLDCTTKLAQPCENLRIQNRISAPKQKKKQDFETLFKRNFKRKTTSATLHGKNTKFRAPASSPTQPPCNMHAAITMRFAAPRTHPCSRYNAIRFLALQNTKGEPITHDYALKPSRPHPPHTGGTFHRRLHPPLHRKTHCFVLRLPPQNKPHAPFMQPSQCA